MRTGTLLPTLLLALALTLTACDSAEPEPPPPPPPAAPALTGLWNGTTTVDGLTFTASLNLVENGGNVNGNGTITYVNPLAVSATGTYNFPTVSMTIRSSGFADLNFTGTLGADGQSISGTMSASGFDNFGITFRRQ